MVKKMSEKYENFNLETLETSPLTDEQAEQINSFYEQELTANEKYIVTRKAEIKRLQAEIKQLQKEAKESAVNKTSRYARSMGVWEKID